MIFVFGSNTQGIHGAGAAKHAFYYCGAVKGVGEGRTGMSYALPTKWTPRHKMLLIDVNDSVKRFMVYARHHTHRDFKITQVGCGLAGFTKEQIAPLFGWAGIEPNCYFDEAWKNLLPKVAKFWGTN